MATVDDLRQWITANESFLSGTAALVALAGLVLLPIGKALRRMIVIRRTDTRVDAGLAPGPDKPGQVAAPAVGETGLAAANEPILAILPYNAAGEIAPALRSGISRSRRPS